MIASPQMNLESNDIVAFPSNFKQRMETSFLIHQVPQKIKFIYTDRAWSIKTDGSYNTVWFIHYRMVHTIQCTVVSS